MLESPVHVDTASYAIFGFDLIHRCALRTLYHDRLLSIIHLVVRSNHDAWLLRLPALGLLPATSGKYPASNV